MNRFFVSPKNIGDKCLIIDKKDDVNHINKVLRLKVGDDIEVADGIKWEYIAEIISLNKDIVEGKIVDKNACAKEPDIDFTLFQGIPKKGKMDLIIQKNVEIGYVIHHLIKCHLRTYFRYNSPFALLCRRF